ncbi:hypothetical protein SMICM304S_07439 [Streptomyces microflavus]
MAHEGEERDAYIRELKTIMFRYLDPLLGDDAPHQATKNCQAPQPHQAGCLERAPSAAPGAPGSHKYPLGV